MSWAQFGSAALGLAAKGGGAPVSPSTAVGSSDGQTGSKVFNFNPPVYQGQAGNITSQGVSVDWLVLAALGVTALWLMKKSK